MNHQLITGTCSVCDRKDVPVRHFEVCASTGECIQICTTCQPPPKEVMVTPPLLQLRWPMQDSVAPSGSATFRC